MCMFVQAEQSCLPRIVTAKNRDPCQGTVLLAKERHNEELWHTRASITAQHLLAVCSAFAVTVMP